MNRMENINHTAQNETIESDNSNKWSELEGLKYQDEKHEEESLAQEDIAHDKNERIRLAAEQVKAAYRNAEVSTNSSVENSIKDGQTTKAQVNESGATELQQPSHEPVLPEKKMGTYAKSEQARIDRLKSNMRSTYDIDFYRHKQIKTRPNVFVKATRLVFDKVGIKTKWSEDRRDREAMSIIVKEHDEEREAKIREYEQAKIQREEAKEREAKEREAKEREWKKSEEERRAAQKAESDKEAAQAIGSERIFNKFQKLHNERAQELVERDLNSRLLKVDDLEAEAYPGNPDVQKEVIPFNGHDIPVYNLSGVDFSLLTTTIDYRKANDDTAWDIGTETYKRIMADPSLWCLRRDQAEKQKGFGTDGASAMGNTISTSYWDSHQSIDRHVSGDLLYGFDNVTPDSILEITNGDAGSSNMGGDEDTLVSSPDEIKNLNKPRMDNCGYNEVTLRRYSENGIPKKPDYIVTKSGRITEVALRHAAFFDVPIINVNSDIYERRVYEEGKKVLNSISSNDSYEEISNKLEEILGITAYRNIIDLKEIVGKNRDKANMQLLERRVSSHDPEPIKTLEKCAEVSQIELDKRIDFIKDTLKNATIALESAANDNSPLKKIEIPGFKDITVRKEEGVQVPGSCNKLCIGFKLSGNTRYVTTDIYDGGNIYNANEAIERGKLTPEDVKNSNSDLYNELEPIVTRYLAARESATKTRS